MRRWLPSTVFGQLALVIALVLAGAAVLALVLGREMAVRPAADQMAQALRSFVQVVEQAERGSGQDDVVAHLRAAGLQVDTQPPPAAGRVLPLMGLLRDRAASALAPRALRVVRAGQTQQLWIQLRTTPAVWVSLTPEAPLQRRRRLSLVLLLGCVALVWAAAAWLARRLVAPLRALARQAPGLVRGEVDTPVPAGGPREVRELALALHEAGHDVRRAAEERAFMLAGISHDLRTPLTRVQFATELLPDTDPQLREGIARDVAEIDAILGQFIAYARDGRDEAVEAVDLAEICRSVGSAAGEAWEVELCQDSAPMRGRPLALRRAVENLVVNAGRHGAAPYRLRLTRTGATWQVEVDDQGSGLDAAAAERARQPFVHQGPGAGSGLGLAIVERVARQHGGELRLLPNLPTGLRAVLRLPGT